MTKKVESSKKDYYYYYNNKIIMLILYVNLEHTKKWYLVNLLTINFFINNNYINLTQAQLISSTYRFYVIIFKIRKIRRTKCNKNNNVNYYC
jgi:hypothetical protein